MRAQGNAGSLRTVLPFLVQTMVVGCPGGGQCLRTEAVGGIVIAGRDAVCVGSSRGEVRRVLLMEAPCSLAPPGTSAAKRSDGICCII